MAGQIPWWKRIVASTVVAVLLGLTVSVYIFNWHHTSMLTNIFGGATVLAMLFFRLVHWTPRRKIRRHIGS